MRVSFFGSALRQQRAETHLFHFLDDLRVAHPFHPILQVDRHIEAPADLVRRLGQAVAPEPDLAGQLGRLVVGVHVDLELGDFEPAPGVQVVVGLPQQTVPVADRAGEHADVDVVELLPRPLVFGVVDDELEVGRNPGGKWGA